MTNINHAAISDAKSAKQKSNMVQKFLASASVGVITMIMAGSAHGQVLPGECAPNPLIDGGTATCVAPAPIVIDPIETDTDNVTLNIGSPGTATTVVSGVGDAVQMTGSGNQTLNIINAGSLVRGRDNGADIQITNGIGNLTIINGGTVIGGNSGIVANHNGTGDIFIRSTTATGFNNDGIHAEITNIVNTGNISIISEGDTSGGEYGIYVENEGLGDISVNANNATGTAEAGISAVNTNNIGTGDITITATGDVSGGGSGIQAATDGLGAINIMATNVSGATKFGIGVVNQNNANASAISISANGDVTGGEHGIITASAGTGSISVVAGNVTGTNAMGISADGRGDISIEATGDIFGGKTGVSAISQGLGRINVDVTGVTAVINNAIVAAIGDSNNVTDITIAATGDVSGGEGGIIAYNNGSGAITISTAGVNGTLNDGINANNNNSNGTGDVSIIASGDVVGGHDGIRANNNGTTDLIVEAGTVTGGTGDGILVTTQGLDMSVTATGLVTGGDDGIEAINNGFGDLTVVATGSANWEQPAIYR